MSLKLPPEISELTTTDGSRLVIEELAFNVFNLLKDHDEDSVIKLLDPYDDDGNPKYDNWRDAYFASTYFDEARRKQQLTYEIYKNKTIPAKGSSCIQCGSTNVIEVGKYNRALDEAGSVVYFCRNCREKFSL